MKTASATLDPEIVSGSVVETLNRHRMIPRKVYEGYIQAQASDAGKAYNHAFFGTWGQRFLQAEPVIARDPTFACLYARHILQTKWPEPLKAIAEKSIRRLGPRNRQDYAALPEPAVPVQAAVKTASAQLNAKVARGHHLVQVLVRYDMVSKRLRAAYASEVGYALRYSLEVKAPFTEAEVGPALAAKPGDGVEYARTWRQPSPALEAAILALGDPFLAYRYASALSGGKHRRWPEGEPLIASNLETGFRYAWTILQSQRFPAVENLVAHHPNSQFGEAYVKEILKGDTALLPPPGPVTASLKTASSQLNLQGGMKLLKLLDTLMRQGFVTKRVRAAIASNADMATMYMIRTHLPDGQRWPEAEPALAQDPKMALPYARIHVGGRWPEAEPYIAQSAANSYEYALSVLEGPFPAAEPVLARDDEFNFLYAWRVLDLPREEAKTWGRSYRQSHHTASAKTASSQLRLSWKAPELFEILVHYGMDKRIKQAILDLKLNPYRLWELVRNRWGYGQSRHQPQRLPWPEVERIFIDQYVKGPQDYALAYARFVIRSRWPEAEPLFAQNLEDIFWYANDCLGGRFPAGEPLVAKHLLAEDNDDRDFGQACRYWDKWIGDPAGIPKYETNGVMTRWAQGILAGKTAALKTASSQLPKFFPWTLLVAPLDRAGMLSKRLREAMAHIPGREAEMGHRVAVLLGRRFPEAEPAIAADAGWAMNYITSFIKGPWPEAEPAIARATLEGIADPDRLNYNVIDYVMDRIREAGEVAGKATMMDWAERVLAGKTATLKTASSQLLFGKDIEVGAVLGALLKADLLTSQLKRVALAECPRGDLLYAAQAMQRPWPEAESVIAQDAGTASRYANDPLRERWAPAEAAIAADVRYWDRASLVPPSVVWYYTGLINPGYDRLTPYIQKATDALAWARQLGQGKTSALKTASATLNPAVDWDEGLPEVLACLRRYDMLSKPIKAALFADPHHTVLVFEASDHGTRWLEAEPSIMTSPADAARYLSEEDRPIGPLPEFEPTFLPTPRGAFLYAYDVMHARWPAAEPMLAQAAIDGSAPALLYYAFMVVRAPQVPSLPNDLRRLWGDRAAAWGRMTLAGKQASRKTASSQLSINMGQRGGVLGALGQHKMLSKAILQAMKRNPMTATLYAADVVQQRCPELEPLILTSARAARLYAWAVLHKRWKEAEPIIARDPETAGIYATTQMKRAWPEAEPAIARGDWVSDYCAKCLKIKDAVKVMDWVHAMKKVPIPPLPGAKTAAATVHNSLIGPNLLTALQRYGMLSKPMVAAITQSPHFALIYANYVLEARFPAGEPAIARGNGIQLYGKYTLAKCDDNEAKLAFARMTAAKLLNPYDLVTLLKEMKATDPTEDLRARCMASLTGGLCFCLLYHEKLPQELEALLDRTDRDVNEQAALEYVRDVLQATWPTFERYLARVNARNTVHAGIFARNYLSLACVKHAIQHGGAFEPAFVQAFLTDQYSETWATYASEYESAPLTGREIQDTSVFSSRLAMQDYSPKPNLDPWIYCAWVFGNDRDFNARKKITSYLQKNHPECVEDAGAGGYVHVEWTATKAMSKAAMAAEGLGRADFDKVYGARRMDEYQMNGFFPEPVQSSLKTASSQLDTGVVSGYLIQTLVRSGLVSPRLRSGLASDPLNAARYAFFTDGRFPAGEPAIARGLLDPTPGDKFAVIRSVMGNYVRRFIQPTLSFKDRRALDWEQRWAKQVLAGTPKTASSQLDFADTLCLGNLIGVLLTHGMLTNRLKKAFLSVADPADAINAVRAYRRPWPEAEPLLAQDPSIAADYATETLKGRFPLAEQEWHKVAPLWWKEPTDVPFALTRYYDRLVRTDPPHADSYFKGAWRWLQSGKTSSLRTASAQLDLDRIMPDPDAPNFNGYIGWVEALHRTGLQTKAIYQAYLSNPWMALSYAASCQNRRPSPDILAAIQQHEGALEWYEDWEFDRQVEPNPEIDDAGLGEEPHLAHLKTASSQLGVRRDDFATVFDALGRSGMGKGIRDLLASYPPAQLLKLIHLLGYRYPHLRLPWPEVEAVFLKDPDYAALYAIQCIDGPWPEAEPVIATSGEAAYRYALRCLESRFPAGEPAIARMILGPSTLDSFHGIDYWRTYISSVWSPGQELMTDEKAAIAWAKQVVGTHPVQAILKTASSQLPWPQADGLVFNHLIDALQRNGMLSKRILGAMAATPKAAWRYAKIFLRRRWPEAEPAIARDPKIAMWYATDVIQGPWPEAEPAIARGDWAEMYARQVLHLPYPQIRKWREHMLGHPA